MIVTLEGKTLVVSGGTQGLGETIARLAFASGVEGIAIVGRNAERGARVAGALSQPGRPAVFIQADLAEPAAPAAIMAQAIERLGRVDCLVNAAALTDRASLETGTLDDWDRLFSVNARAPFFLMQAAVADMKARQAPGAIVNILSVNAHCGAPDLAIYSATKGALATLTRNIANAHLADRIRVNGINMGWVATPTEQQMQARILGKGEDWEKAAAAVLPLGRLLTMGEVAQLSLFVLSDASGLMTGTLIDMEQAVLGAPPRGID
ncbi:SDR family oxidoreductase [Mesorhizobium sp. M9A.F.Ca.ET.002.03.1.2]|uniref:SDR family oxidoreductase n=1 Tax=Mesorhizobium sp. M9A.F.Ca.ET.002.03.1.2 TaxID=2493668 RepID=UPI000F74D77F|nr:SDR family oxidoreductase [Mesorhizobium sp. M9A.F.Ca.ET.002.03.1.2]AZN98541.1 SDR family oxidoreductase [Mesorhizobium sp. M9A.F.Ca.ET.002.03.1.2]